MISIKSMFPLPAALLFAVATSGVAVAGEMMQKTTMHNFADQSVIEGAEATLMRMDHGINMTVDTVGLTPGHAVTTWFVVFNNPENCSGGECGEDDIFNLDADGKFILNDDGSPPMNGAQIEAANISALWGAGLVVDEGGKAKFFGRLPVGDPSGAIFGTGLVDAHKAEVHAVIRDHMEVKPGMSDEMIGTFNGGCSPDFPFEPCEDLQFAVFKPAM